MALASNTEQSAPIDQESLNPRLTEVLDAGLRTLRSGEMTKGLMAIPLQTRIVTI
jgi:hypothetical protein